MNRAEYRVYLASDDWRRRRETLIRAHDSRCGLCGIPRCLARPWDKVDLNVHHLTYANVGDENLQDVEVLCDPCHKARERGYPARTFRDEVEWAVIAWLTLMGARYNIQVHEETWSRFYAEAKEKQLTVLEVDGIFGKLFRGAAKAFTFSAWQDACHWQYVCRALHPREKQLRLNTKGAE